MGSRSKALKATGLPPYLGGPMEMLPKLDEGGPATAPLLHEKPASSNHDHWPCHFHHHKPSAQPKTKHALCRAWGEKGCRSKSSPTNLKLNCTGTPSPRPHGPSTPQRPHSPHSTWVAQSVPHKGNRASPRPHSPSTPHRPHSLHSIWADKDAADLIQRNIVLFKQKQQSITFVIVLESAKGRDPLLQQLFGLRLALCTSYLHNQCL